jgi:hypothetical protein
MSTGSIRSASRNRGTRLLFGTAMSKSSSPPWFHWVNISVDDVVVVTSRSMSRFSSTLCTTGSLAKSFHVMMLIVDPPPRPPRHPAVAVSPAAPAPARYVRRDTRRPAVLSEALPRSAVE